MEFEVSKLLEIRFILSLYTKDVKRVIDDAVAVKNYFAQDGLNGLSFSREEKFTEKQNTDLNDYAPIVVEAAIRDAYEEDPRTDKIRITIVTPILSPYIQVSEEPCFVSYSVTGLIVTNVST
jgi:hypothetical protein